MRKFSEQFLHRLGRDNDRSAYVPFPGKIPVRMCIKVWIIEPLKGQQALRHFYHGKWSYQAYVAAMRTFRSLDPLLRMSSVHEYHRAGILYNGNLEQGVYASSRKRILPSLNFPRPVPGPFQPYFAAPATPLRVGGVPFLCLDRTTDWDNVAMAQLKNRCLRDYKVGLGVLANAFGE